MCRGSSIIMGLLKPALSFCKCFLTSSESPPLSWWVGCTHLWGWATENTDNVVMTNLKTFKVPATCKAEYECVLTHVLLCSDRGLCVIKPICHHPIHLDGPVWANCLPHERLLRLDYKKAKIQSTLWSVLTCDTFECRSICRLELWVHLGIIKPGGSLFLTLLTAY